MASNTNHTETTERRLGPESSLHGIKKPDLQDELRKRNLSDAGSKAVLVERLKIALQDPPSARSSTIHCDADAGSSSLPYETPNGLDDASTLEASPSNYSDSYKQEFERIRREIKEIKNLFTNFPAKLESNMQIEITKLRQENEALKTTITVLSSQLAYHSGLTTDNNRHVTYESNQPIVNSAASKSPKETSEESVSQKKPAKTKMKAKKPDGKQPSYSETDQPSSSGATGPLPRSTNNAKPVTVICGDSIIRNVNGWDLSNHQNKVVVKSFPGATVADMTHYLVPTIEKKPQNLVLHVGTNDLPSTDPEELTDKIVDLAKQIELKSPDTSITISGIVQRSKDDGKVESVNKGLKVSCRRFHWHFIDHSEIKLRHLNRGGLHLAQKGTEILVENFKSHISNKV